MLTNAFICLFFIAVWFFIDPDYFIDVVSLQGQTISDFMLALIVWAYIGMTLAFFALHFK